MKKQSAKRLNYCGFGEMWLMWCMKLRAKKLKSSEEELKIKNNLNLNS